MEGRLAMSLIRILTIRNRAAMRFLWAGLVIFSFYFSRTYSKIESQVTTLIICQKAYEKKSGSQMHDAYLSVLFNSNVNQLGIYKKRPCGGLAYWMVMKCNSAREESFKAMSERYLESQ
jgi:hypothetical protein